MSITGPAVYLSTLLLEKNRSNGKGPSLLVSDWVEEIAEAGFAGLEIWMNHLHFSSRSEWELIQERSAESSLPVALISGALPADSSDKSRRYLDSVLEACDYFRPDGLKFSLADTARPEALEYIKDWSRDIPREIGLVYDGGVNDAQIMAVSQRALGGRFHGVYRPFLSAPGDIGPMMEAAGDFVANLGVQARKGGGWILLSDAAEVHLSVIDALRGSGFKGAWSLEFTKGAGQPGENIEKMFDNAEKDLNFLIEAQARAGSASAEAARPKAGRPGRGKE